MRSEGAEGSSSTSDCDDPLVVIACAAETDACPAACRENAKEEEDQAPKSGSLVITASAASGRKAIRNTTSDLDTLKFKTSEEVTISKITLERYGYSDSKDVAGIRLEDQDGNVIAESKTINSKDQVTLSLKKDYKVIDGNFNATVVVSLGAAAKSSTIGFKVVDVVSTAEDVDLGDYAPYEYDVVDYTAVSDISLTNKDSDKDYNYEAGEFYQAAKLKINATTSALEVNGFTLTNAGNLDLEEFLSDVDVSVDSKSLKNVKWSIDDDELTISFDPYEINAKGNATFNVTVALADFDEYGTAVRLGIAKSTDVKIVEKKTGARVTVALPMADYTNYYVDDAGVNATYGYFDYVDNGVITYTTNALCVAGGATSCTELDYTASEKFTLSWSSHAFAGSKIKLNSTKLGNIDAAQGSDDVVVLSGSIELSEAVDRVSFDITATYSEDSDIIDSMRLLIAGEEYDAEKTTYVGGSKKGEFSFSNVEIEKSGKVQILVDINDEAKQNAVVTFTTPTSLNKNVIANGTARYTDAKSTIKSSEIAGSISFASKVTVQASKASLENKSSKAIEFITNQTSRKVVFDGTYTAKKGDVYLDTVKIDGTSSLATSDDVEFYVYIDGEEVASSLDLGEEETFSDVLVKAGKSVSVKVEAEVYSENEGTVNATIELKGTDDNDNEAGKASDTLVEMKVKEAGSATISAEAVKNTVLLRAKNQKIAEFVIKPSNASDDDLSLDSFELVFTPTDLEEWNGTSYTAKSTIASTDIRVKVDGVEQDDEDLTYNPYVDMGNGVTVEVYLKKEYRGSLKMKVWHVNSATAATPSKEFSKRYAEALVSLHTEDADGSTKVYLSVEKADSDLVVSNVVLTTDYGDAAVAASCSDTHFELNGAGDACVVKSTYDGGFDDTDSANPKCSDTHFELVGGACVVKSTYDGGFTAGSAATNTIVLTTDEVSDGDDFEVAAYSDKSTHFITAISYDVDGSTVTIKKSEFNDYFKDGESYAKIFKVD